MRSHRRHLFLLGLAAACAAGAACGDSRSRQSASPALSPVSPTPLATASRSSGPAATGPAAASALPGGGGNEGRSVSLPPEGAIGMLDVAFPGRNESFLFRQTLEAKYRDGLRRQATSSYVDIEGDLVWTQEYLRYRVNACGHGDAVQRVMNQIDGAPAPPVCGSSPTGTVAFPPRNESFDFRQELERKYRDGLRRPASSTFVDVEGSIVWTQEYLRYRVNACGHTAASQKVIDQIDGRGIAAVCNADLSGVWIGERTASPFNPFVMDLVQTGNRVSGTYKDRGANGFFGGTITGDRLEGRLEFGDTGGLVDARWDGADVVNGNMTIGAGVGNRSFEMRRQR